jgi:hypothetical protein
MAQALATQKGFDHAEMVRRILTISEMAFFADNGTLFPRDLWVFWWVCLIWAQAW